MESFAPIKEDRGAFKSTKQIAFWNFFFSFNCNISSENRYYMDQNL